MKKLIAMVMTAAMVASLVPATAFAADKVNATASVVNSWTRKDSESTSITNPGAPELQLKLTDVSSQATDPTKTYEFKVALDGATFDMNGNGKLDAAEINALKASVSVVLAPEGTSGSPGSATYTAASKATDAQVDAYLEAVYEDMKDNTLDGKNGTENVTYPSNLYYNTTNLATAPTAQSDLAKVEYTLFGSGKMFAEVTNSLSITKNDYSSKSAIETAVVDAFGGANKAALGFTGNYASFAAANKVNSEGSLVAGYNMTDNTTGTAVTTWVAKATVLAWAKDNGFADAISGDDYASEATIYIPSYADLKTATWGGLTNFVKGNLYAGLGKNDYAAGSAHGTARTSLDVDLTDYDAVDLDEVTITISCNGDPLQKGDIFTIDLLSVLDKAKTAYVSVTSDDITISNDGEDLVYVSVEDEGVTASIKKVATVAEEEHTVLSKDLVIKSTVGNFENGQVIELKLNNGFEFFKVLNTGSGYTLTKVDDNIVELVVNGASDKIEVKAADIEIEATDAKSGATAVITVKATNKNSAGAILTGAFNAKTTVEVMKVVDYTVVLTVDEDEEVPVFYNGVNVDNYGLTDDADHWSLEVTAEETFPGAWSFRKGFNFELPEGVFVTDVEITNVEGFLKSSSANGSAATINKDGMEKEFVTAYQDGDNVNFEFDKRVFDDVDATLAKDEASVSFKLQLVADPDFTGDVVLKLNGELVDEQEVTIAKFVAPFTVKAEQNDLKIDYRYTEIPTSIVVTEAEAGLWDAGKAEFAFAVEKPDYIVFEDDPTFTVDKESGMELDDDKLMKVAGEDYEAIHFTVDKESDEAATVTISDLSLFMQRSIPAGAYDLEAWTSMWANYEAQPLFAPNCTHGTYAAHETADCDELSFVGDVCDYSDVVKEAFVNVVTAGREQDDASFTTVVEIKIGDDIMKAGGKEISLKELKTQPAYINAKGYTMLPIRAVAVALGINTENVQWNQDTQTVIILYGQRVITMQVGSNTVYAAGTPIPATSSVEIKEGRAYLGLRDLATALGVSKIDWDGNNKIAYLNTTVAEAKAAQ